MTNVEREKIAALASKSLILREVWLRAVLPVAARLIVPSKSLILREVWLRERQDSLSTQLAANEKVKKKWEMSSSIEVIQPQAVNGKRRA